MNLLVVEIVLGFVAVHGAVLPIISWREDAGLLEVLRVTARFRSIRLSR